jgi:glycosyltransferase involved in cell wall biosynthesis
VPRVVSGLFFFPRGGSAYVTRALARALPGAGWEATIVAGSLGPTTALTNAERFFAGLDVRALDYTAAAGLADPLSGDPPFQPSFEDRPGSPDRVFAAVDDGPYERLVDAWARTLEQAGAGDADVLHLNHLTPLHEASRRAAPGVPVVTQLHGTELQLLRAIAAGPPAAWRFAERWAERMRAWAEVSAHVLSPVSGQAEVAALLGLPPDRVSSLPGGVDLERFDRRHWSTEERLSFWRHWLVGDPQGWDETGVAGSVRYAEADLAAFAAGGPVLVYVGRYTEVKRVPLLIRAYARARTSFHRTAPLVLVGGHPGEWEGEHPLAVIGETGVQDVFLAGWRSHDDLPDAFAASDLIVLPSVREAFGLVLAEAMACGLPALAVNAYGPAEIVDSGETGWLVPPDDERALSDALVEAVGEPDERARRGELAYERSRARFGWPGIARRVAGVYETVRS